MAHGEQGDGNDVGAEPGSPSDGGQQAPPSDAACRRRINSLANPQASGGCLLQPSARVTDTRS